MQSAAPSTRATEHSGRNPDIRAEQQREETMRATAAETSVRESSWVTPREAAAYLGVGVDTIYEACAAADLKHVKLGYRTIRLRREWIDTWAEKHATPAR
jgi:excisionase family DNA binding protein